MHKINLRIRDLSVKCKTTTHLTRNKSLSLRTRQRVLKSELKARSLKGKIELDFMKMKGFALGKPLEEDEKTQQLEAHIPSRGLVSTVCKELPELNSVAKNPGRKQATVTCRHLTKEDVQVETT